MSDSPSPPPRPDNVTDPIEWARLRFERQKLALELRIRRREMEEKLDRSVWRDLLTNPLSIAIVGGALTLMTTVVTNFLTAKANREAEQSRAELARESARQSLQADLIKNFVESPKSETVRENLRFLADAGLIPDYADSIQKYLVANPGLAPQIGSGLNFLPGGEPISESLQQRLRETVGLFRNFLRSKGFPDLDHDISVFVYSSNVPVPIPNLAPSNDPNSFYYAGTIYIHKDLSDDVSIALREFSHHALMNAIGRDMFRQTAVESALADYLPATFLKSPDIGSAFARMKGPLASRFRSLAGQQLYDAEGTKDKDSVGWFPRGIVWAQALWACRDPKRSERVDDMILPAWQKANVPPLDDDSVEARFGTALTATSNPEGACLSEQIVRRRLPIQK
jgi:hypothetical protein